MAYVFARVKHPFFTKGLTPPLFGHTYTQAITIDPVANPCIILKRAVAETRGAGLAGFWGGYHVEMGQVRFWGGDLPRETGFQGLLAGQVPPRFSYLPRRPYRPAPLMYPTRPAASIDLHRTSRRPVPSFNRSNRV